MKKLLGISVIAMLAVAPAFAAGETYDPTTAQPSAKPANVEVSAVTATADPEFALVAANAATDNNAASAGYVKGAYNAAIKAINKVNAKTTVDAGNGLAKTGNTMTVDLTSTGGLQLDGSTDGSKTVGIKAGDGIKTDANGVAVDLTSKSGLEISSNQLQVKAGNGTQIEQTNGTLEVKAGNGVDVDANGVKVKAADGSITVGASGVSVGLTTNGGIVNNATDDKLELKVDNSTVEVDATNGVQVKNGGVTLAKIASGAIQNGSANGATNDKLTTKDYVDESIAGLGMANYATITGVDNTINALSTTVGEFALASGTVNGTATVAIMQDWSNPNTPTTINVDTSALNVGTAITEGSVTINKTAYATANQ